MKISDHLLDPIRIKYFSHKDFEDFFYQTEKEYYEPFFNLSREQSNHFELVANIVVCNQCILNCEYCSFRKKSSHKHFLLNTKEIIEKSITVKKLGINAIILESGVLDKKGFKLFLDSIQLLKKEWYPKIYLDVGSQSLIEYPEIFDLDIPFFIDYVPGNEEFRSSLNSFDKTKELWSQLKLKPNREIYANFIVDLPGQDFSDLVSDLLFLLNSPHIQGIKVSPFYPQKNTNFSLFAEACFLTTLKVISLSRLYRPEWKIFISPYINKLEYEDTMKKAIDIGADKAVLEFNLDDTGNILQKKIESLK